HTSVEWSLVNESCRFLHTAPDLRYAVVVKVEGAQVSWTKSAAGYTGTFRASGTRPIRLIAAVATDREAADPLARATAVAGPADRVGHLEWWRRFWNRSWI